MSDETEISPNLHEGLRPLAWLVGKWRTSQGVGQYPTVKDFEYTEEVEFFHTGQPVLQFSLYSFNSSTQKPMHREVGFIRMKPGTNVVALTSAHNTGLADMEEGQVSGEELTLQTSSLGRMSFGTPPAVLLLKRRFRKVGDKLEQVLDMETSTTPLTEHLRAVYDRVL